VVHLKKKDVSEVFSNGNVFIFINRETLSSVLAGCVFIFIFSVTILFFIHVQIHTEGSL